MIPTVATNVIDTAGCGDAFFRSVLAATASEIPPFGRLPFGQLPSRHCGKRTRSTGQLRGTGPSGVAADTPCQPSTRMTPTLLPAGVIGSAGAVGAEPGRREMFDAIGNVVGWVGTIALLSSFWLLTVKRTTSDGYQYQALNAVGAFLLAFTAAQAQAWSAVALNVIWCIIACTGLARSRKERPASAPKRPPEDSRSHGLE